MANVEGVEGEQKNRAAADREARRTPTLTGLAEDLRRIDKDLQDLAGLWRHHSDRESVATGDSTLPRAAEGKAQSKVAPDFWDAHATFLALRSRLRVVNELLRGDLHGAPDWLRDAARVLHEVDADMARVDRDLTAWHAAYDHTPGRDDPIPF